MVWLLALIFSSVSNAIGIINNHYPVFWNVDESVDPYVDITQYNILPRNWTQVGNGCSNPNCKSWYNYPSNI